MSKEVKIVIPDKLSELNVKQFVEWQEVVENNKGDDGKTEINNFLKQKAVSIFCGVPLQIVMKMQYKEFNAVANQVLKVVNINRTDLVMRFKFKDVEYGFIPNFDEISLGELADLSSYTGSAKDLNKALAVMYRPVVRTFKNKFLGITQYELEEYNGTEDRAELFKELSLEIALGASFFLLNSYISLGTHMKEYLLAEQRAGHTVSQTSQSSTTSTDGTTV